MIEAASISKTFGKIRAVRDLTLRIPRGELFCFLGPNGAGKTTTIKMLIGLLRPTAGVVRIGGFDIHKEPVAAKRQIGYIPDMPYLYDRLTAAEFFLFTGDLYGLSRTETLGAMEASFDQFGLGEHRASLVRDLSHGMRQRLLYAATFLHNPRVLFIDEPLTGLDPSSIRLIKDLLVAKARGGMTIFVTTHILALAEEIADRIGIILEGTLSALGSPAVLVRQYGARNVEEVFLRLVADASPRRD